MKKSLMELLGTFFLILTFVITDNPFAVAAMLMAWVYIGGYVSGAHYNPMVTLAVALRSKHIPEHTLWYIAAQIIGGFLAFVVAAFLGAEILLPMPDASLSLVQALVIEAGLAFVLAFVVLVVTTSEKFKASDIFGFAIGFTIPALAAIGKVTTGGLFNPAISLGATLFGLTKGMVVSWEHLAIYVIGAFIGGISAAYAFKFFFEEK